MYTSGPIYTEQTYQSTEQLNLLRPAGAASNTAETAKDALTWTDRPPTPEVIKPYQHYARQPAGTITRHFGTARDASWQGPFGCKSKASQQSAADCMASYPDSELGRWKLETSEVIYSSTKKEPLGHTFSRGYDMPAGLGTDIPFGRPLHVREQEEKNSTQKIIFPEQPVTDGQPQTRQMYVMSHGSFEPGEQRKRDYDWSRANKDPRTTRFGYVDRKGQQTSMKQILQPDLDEAVAQKPVTSSIYDRHKATLGDELGKPRLLGAGNRPQLGLNHVFGKPSAREAEPCVGELLRGWYTPEQQQPDPDLGKSLREGWRNTPHTDKSFGVPSVRSDIPLPLTRSVANTKNYGNEPSARQLLTPPKCVDLGVKEEHLLALISRPELHQLLDEAGISMEAEEFEAIFCSAAEVDGAVGQLEDLQCSLESFIKVRQHIMQQQAGLA